MMGITNIVESPRVFLSKGQYEFLLVDRGGGLSSNNYHFEKLSLAPRSSYPDMKSPFNVWYVVF